MATNLSAIRDVPNARTNSVLNEPAKTPCKAQLQAQQVYGAAEHSFQTQRRHSTTVKPLRRPLPILDERILSLKAGINALNTQLKRLKTPDEKNAYMKRQFNEMLGLQILFEALQSINDLNQNEKALLNKIATTLVGFHVGYFYAPHERPYEVFEKLSPFLQEIYVKDKYAAFYALKDVSSRNTHSFRFLCRELLLIVQKQKHHRYAKPGQYGLGIRDCAFGFFVARELAELMLHPLYETIKGTLEFNGIEKLYSMGRGHAQAEVPTVADARDHEVVLSEVNPLARVNSPMAKASGPSVVPLNVSHQVSAWSLTPTPARLPTPVLQTHNQPPAVLNQFKTWSPILLPGIFESVQQKFAEANAQTMGGLLSQLEQIHEAMTSEDQAWYQHSLDRARSRAEIIKQSNGPRNHQMTGSVPYNTSALFKKIGQEVQHLDAKAANLSLIIMEEIYKNMSLQDQDQYEHVLKKVRTRVALL